MVGRCLKPVLHLEDWLARADVADGWLFRRISNDGKTVTGDPMSDRADARVVQRHVAAAGLDPALFGGHSLRAGFLTAAARSGFGAEDLAADLGIAARREDGTHTAPIVAVRSMLLIATAEAPVPALDTSWPNPRDTVGL